MPPLKLVPVCEDTSMTAMSVPAPPASVVPPKTV
jgi:hypothetical protein